MLTVLSGPGGTEPVSLDTTLYLPEVGQRRRTRCRRSCWPTASAARSAASPTDAAGLRRPRLRRAGLDRARASAAAAAQIHLDSPDYEVRDAQRLLDWLAARPEIARTGRATRRSARSAARTAARSRSDARRAGPAGRRDRADDHLERPGPRVPARVDRRGTGRTGVFKKQWAGLFFGSGGSAGEPERPARARRRRETRRRRRRTRIAGAEPPSTGGCSAGRSDPACGRFARDVCAAYLDVATDGPGRAEQTIALLRRSSPAAVLDKIKAPTLLIQGQADSLFPLSEAEANYRGIAATGTPVRVDWFTGGHDGGAGPAVATGTGCGS